MNLHTSTLCLGLAVLLTACGESSVEVVTTTVTQPSRTPVVKLFDGEFFEASGVVHVAKDDSILFVDDNRPGNIAWMKLDSAGAPGGDVRLIPLGVEVQDPEDITFDGEHYYVIGSQSARKSGRKIGLVRFKFDPVSGRATELESISGLRDFLVANMSSLPGMNEAGSKDGLNIEGLAWHAGESSLLLGLRSPRSGSDAVVIKLKFREPAAALSLDNLELAGPPVHLTLDGSGIRGLTYDSDADRVLVITGPTEKQGNRPFALWEWRDSNVRRVAYLDAKLKPEGVSRRGEVLVIVCDASMHLTMRAP